LSKINLRFAKISYIPSLRNGNFKGALKQGGRVTASPMESPFMDLISAPI